jgi:N6-adenosine-specific RNA methylase IME4
MLWALSENLHRRHLDESQRAMVAARAKPMFEAEAAKRVGGRPKKGEKPRTNSSGVSSAEQAGSLLNVGQTQVKLAANVLKHGTAEVVRAVDSGKLAVSAAAQLAKLPAAKQSAIMERVDKRKGGDIRPGLVRALAKQEEKRQVAAEIEAEPAPMPEGPYRVIVSDPPWKYEKRAGDATHRGDLPYPDMTTEEICALDVGELAHPEGCILWLWTTNAFMRDAFKVLDAWGFGEKTILTWVKDKMGLGDWLRGKTEHCILAVKGRPTILLNNETTVLEGPLREHSRKPEEFYALVERMCPGSKLEMFCRTPRDGWAKWGAETGKFNAA